MVKIGDSFISESMITSVKSQDGRAGFLICIYTVNGEEYKESFTYKNERDLRLSELIRSIDRYNNNLDLTAAIMSLKGELQVIKSIAGLPSEVSMKAVEGVYDDEPIEHLNLLDSSYTALKKYNKDITTIGDIRRLGWNGVKRLKGVGNMRLKDIKNKYEKYTGANL